MDRCGLTGGKEPVPVKSVEVELEVRDHVATVVSTLNYENKEDKPLEAVFVFPLPGDAAVCHFSAQIGQTQIVAEVKEKQETHLQVKALSAISHPETRCCSWSPSTPEGVWLLGAGSRSGCCPGKDQRGGGEAQTCIASSVTKCVDAVNALLGCNVQKDALGL